MRLYIGNIPYERCDDRFLRELFQEYDVVDTHVVLDRETGKPRGICFLNVRSDSDAQNAIATLDGTMIDGRRMTVSVAREPVRKQQSRGGGHAPQRGRAHSQSRHADDWEW